MKTVKPWQATPTELLKQAINFLNQDTENTRQIAFLLLDVGVETTFKTFLLLPETITKVEISHGKRRAATEGSFYDLVKAIKQASKERLEEIDLEDVLYYHSIRNKLYHQGDGVIPSSTVAEKYAEIAVKLLDVLLSVDLRYLLLEKDHLEKLVDERRERIKKELDPIREQLRDSIRRMHQQMANDFEKYGYDIWLGSFRDKMQEYIDKVNQPDFRRWKTAVKRFIRDGLFIFDDDCIPVMRYEGDEMYYDFPKEICHANPAGPPPWPMCGDFDDCAYYLDESCDVAITEFPFLQLTLADNFTEFLLLLAEHINEISTPITVEEYYEIQDILTWDADRWIQSEGFDKELERIRSGAVKLLVSLTTNILVKTYE